MKRRIIVLGALLVTAFAASLACRDNQEPAPPPPPKLESAKVVNELLILCLDRKLVSAETYYYDLKVHTTDGQVVEHSDEPDLTRLSLMKSGRVVAMNLNSEEGSRCHFLPVELAFHGFGELGYEASQALTARLAEDKITSLEVWLAKSADKFDPAHVIDHRTFEPPKSAKPPGVKPDFVPCDPARPELPCTPNTPPPDVR